MSCEPSDERSDLSNKLLRRSVAGDEVVGGPAQVVSGDAQLPGSCMALHSTACLCRYMAVRVNLVMSCLL